MKPLLIVTLGLLISIAACAPSPEIVATAMAQTEAALPTETPTPPPTATFTFTPEPPTSTPTLTPTSTPDLQVITTDPEDILCAKTDLPSGGDYILRPFNYQPHVTNDLVIRYGTTFNGGAWDKDYVKEYISRTGRIDGWLLDFKKSNDGYSGYTFIQCTVAKFQTIAGAQLAVQEYNDAENHGEPKWYLNPDRSIGDVSIVISYATSITESSFTLNGASYTQVSYQLYEVDFSYRNYRVTIIGYGKANLDLDDLYYVGEQILKKLENAPLSAP